MIAKLILAAVLATAASTPSLSVETLEGETWTLADKRGQWVVINFWATWCAPCLKEMPQLAALDKDRADVDVIGLAYEQISPDDMRAFLEHRPAGYPIAILDVFAPPADFETPRGLPMTVLIEPGGDVAEKFVGAVTARELEAAIAKHGQKR